MRSHQKDGIRQGLAPVREDINPRHSIQERWSFQCSGHGLPSNIRGLRNRFRYLRRIGRFPLLNIGDISRPGTISGNDINTERIRMEGWKAQNYGVNPNSSRNNLKQLKLVF